MMRLGARSGVVALVATCVTLATPVVALATTGTATDLHERVTLTAKGTTWKPKIVSYRHATTGTTVRFTIVNADSRRHWFQFGKYRTKLLKKGASEVLFYNFTRPVDVKWRVGPGKAVSKTSSGKIVVVFPPHFH
jgi:hypothetical protein